jgi:hypothetical protein
MANPSDINGDWKRATETYKGGELVMLIDGSGGMPFAFGNVEEGNPFAISVEYAVEAKALSSNHVSAFAFGEPDRIFEIPLDGKEESYKYFPGGASYFMPTFDEVVRRYEAGDLRQPAHIVVVSDGDISEATEDPGTLPDERPYAKSIQKMRDFLNNHPEVMLDFIVPRREENQRSQCTLASIVSQVAMQVADNPPRLYVADNVTNLRKSIANVINERTGSTMEQVAEKAVAGVDKPVSSMTMSALRFRKPGETV